MWGLIISMIYPLEMLRHISHGEERTSVHSCGKSDDRGGNGKWKRLRLSLGCPKAYTQCSVTHGSRG